MGIAKIIGILLIAAGALGLIYGFSYTKETHSAKLGPIVLQVQEKEKLNAALATFPDLRPCATTRVGM